MLAAPKTLTLAPPRAEPWAVFSWLIVPSQLAGSVGAWDKGGRARGDRMGGGWQGRRHSCSALLKPLLTDLPEDKREGNAGLGRPFPWATLFMLFVLPSPLKGPSNSSLGQEVSLIFILFKNPPISPLPLGP